jgi:hypothetical protein
MLTPRSMPQMAGTLEAKSVYYKMRDHHFFHYAIWPIAMSVTQVCTDYDGYSPGMLPAASATVRQIRHIMCMCLCRFHGQ